MFCLTLALGYRKLPTTDKFPKSLHKLIAKGSMNLYLYFNNLGVLDYTTSMNYGAKYYNLELLEYGRENRYVFNNAAMNNASKQGHLQCMKLLEGYGLIYSRNTMIAAARGGHLYCLRYLHRKKCGGIDHAIGAAARYGHLRCFIYLLTALPLSNNLTSWSRAADYLRQAVIGGYLSIVQYMINNHSAIIDTEIISESYKLAQRNGHEDVVNFLRDKVV